MGSKLDVLEALKVAHLFGPGVGARLRAPLSWESVLALCLVKKVVSQSDNLPCISSLESGTSSSMKTLLCGRRKRPCDRCDGSPFAGSLSSTPQTPRQLQVR